MRLAEFKKELLRDKNFRREFYNKKDLAFEISEMVMEVRIKQGLTQAELAKRAKTKQSSIARLEGGVSLPSLKFLEKIAKAMNTFLLPPQFASERSETFTMEYKIVNTLSLPIPSYSVEGKSSECVDFKVDNKN
jgi:transcriptional regulator with XRE-family HTH domain